MPRLLVVSDIHGSVRKAKALEEVRRDVTVAAGDLAECGSVDEALEVLDVLASQGAPVVWVPGNCDDPRLASIDKHYNIHGRNVELAGLVFAGAGGSIHTPFGTPFEYSDEELARILEEALAGVEPGSTRLVLVVHTPPYRSGLDRVAGGEYVGSKSLRGVLQRYKPLALATGHIHEAWGVAAPEGVLSVNPGPLGRGHYAIIDIDPEAGAVRARLARLRQSP